MITSAYDVARPIDGYVSSRYLKYWFDSVFRGRYYKIFSKSVRYTINYDSFKTLKSPVPPKSEQDAEKEVMDYIEKNPDAIIICDEVGNGIVPVDQFERTYREQVGRILIEVAKKAERVERVTCGLGQRIK